MITPETDEYAAPATNGSKRNIPQIEHEEDIPFPTKDCSEDSRLDRSVDRNLHETSDIDKEITRSRFRTGRRVLYIAMGAMAAMVIIDLISQHFGAERNMIENAFEAFKLITVTILGYVFGSNGVNGSGFQK